MRRITATVFGIFAIIVIFFMLVQGGDTGVPLGFSLVAIVMIGVIIVSIVRTWLRGF